METVKKKEKRTGRPLKAVKKEVRACIRFSKAEYFIVKAKAAKAALKPSAFIRQVAINAVVSSRLTEEERHIVRQLIGMANNINQIAKVCHQEGSLKALLYFERYRQQLDNLLNRFAA